MYTVVLPNYNHKKFLEKRIESILSQYLSSNDIILLDDFSIDGSREFLEKISENSDSIKLIVNATNSGSTFFQWNKGIQLSKHDFVWIAESDDYADASFIEKVSAPLLADPDVVLSFCQSNRVDELGNITGIYQDDAYEFNKIDFSSSFIMDGKEFISRYLIHSNVIPNASAVIFRKDIYELVGGAPEDLKTNGDWLAWLKMLCYGKVAFIAEPLNYFRYHDASVIGKLKNQISPLNYTEQYDRALRIKFKQFLISNKIVLDTKTKIDNEQYISFDDGNEAIHLIGKKNYFAALPLLLSASIFPKFKSGYLKKILFK